jgi:hypothetical protein
MSDYDGRLSPFNLNLHSLDNVSFPELKNLVPQDVADIFANSELHYTNAKQRGSVFHLFGSLSKYGKLGVTCIGDNEEDAKWIYDQTIKYLRDQAGNLESLNCKQQNPM